MANGDLTRYRAKRDFRVTPEPAAAPPSVEQAGERSFVVQKHWASRLHYDFRLELDGVLVSWAVPKGPSYDPKKMQMAIHVEDHPLAYAGFEGTIPKKQYGAGTVIVWDRGTWRPVGDPHAGLAGGKLLFTLHGEKLAGLWELVRIAKPGDRQDAWMLFKKRDAWARPTADYDVVLALPDSVVARPLGPVETREPRGDAAVAKAPATPRPPDLSASRRAALPARIAPQLATLAAQPPDGEWIVETKFDGYRLGARIDAAGAVALVTRGGHDWTTKMPALAADVAALGLRSAWLDGEIVVLGENGVPDFNALQNAMDQTTSDAVEYFVFDLPFEGGRDLRAVPLRERRAQLAVLLEAAPPRLRLSPAFDATPQAMLEAARRMGLEGVIVKRPDAPYTSERSESWLKLKCHLRQEFVIAGFVDRGGAAREVGSLLLAYHGASGELVYAGNVGTGWSARVGRDLHDRLVAIESKTPLFAKAVIAPGRWSRRTSGGERWVRPELVAEVSFREWTPEGHVRHAVFVGLRLDKPAAAVTRERAVDAPPPAATAPRGERPPASRATAAAGTPPPPREAATSAVRITNPQRVVDASSGLTKLDVVRYYESVAERLLPHLRDRPVSLVRAPDGIGGELFFQKHPETRLPGLRTLDAAYWPGHAALLAIDDADALVAAAQMNTIELHTWNSTTRAIDMPDRVVFDLDPGEGVTWPQVQESAVLVRALLQELGLRSWLKTSGGKGLHVVVPLAPRLGHDEVKAFSQQAVLHLARTIPQRFVAKAGADNRVGRVFVDWLRNGKTATTACAFSARARPGLGVSMPVAWEQLGELKGGAQWTVRTAREHLSFERSDPWAGYATARQTLAKAKKVLEAASAARNEGGAGR